MLNFVEWFPPGHILNSKVQSCDVSDDSQRLLSSVSGHSHPCGCEVLPRCGSDLHLFNG